MTFFEKKLSYHGFFKKNSTDIPDFFKKGDMNRILPREKM